MSFWRRNTGPLERKHARQEVKVGRQTHLDRKRGRGLTVTQRLISKGGLARGHL